MWRFSSGTEKASTKFWELEKKIKEDKHSPGVIVPMSRSKMIYNLVGLLIDEAICEKDLEEFSDELKETVLFLARRV